MYKGWMIYFKGDYEKNKWFAEHIIEVGKKLGLYIELIFKEDIDLQVWGDKLSTRVKGSEKQNPNFVINRSRQDDISFQFEQMGIRVFNSSFTTLMCNHKGRTHQLVNPLGIPSVKTLIGHKVGFAPSRVNLTYPIVLKSVSGHGGSEVEKLEDCSALERALAAWTKEEFVLQELCGTPGVDIRVFVLGKKILGAVRRSSSTSFKSNYSLGGEAKAYRLSENERALVTKIIEAFSFDLVGIDFILDENERFLFNEIEDVVGTRTYYSNYSEDIALLYVEYIKGKLDQRDTR